MTPQLFSEAWISAILVATQKDPVFARSARSMCAQLHLHDGGAGFTVRFDHGVAVEVTPGRDADCDFSLGGDLEQWSFALNQAHFGNAIVPAIGGLNFVGDHVRRAGHALAWNHLWDAVRKVSGRTPADPPLRTAGAFSATETPKSIGPEILGRYRDIAGIQTYYDSVGQGRPVVCVHTGGADSREYRSLLPRLAESGWHAIAVDMPGHGKSYPNLDTLRPIETSEEWVDFLLAFARELSLDRPVFIGCAMSASLLLHLAARYPESTSAVVCANGTATFHNVLTEDVLDVLDHPQVNVGEYMESLTPPLLGPGLSEVRRNECVWHNARNLTSTVMRADIGMYTAHDITNDLGKILAPVLHLRGEYDATVSDANCALIRNGIRNVTMVDLPGVGHLPMVENPDLFDDAVDTFLRTLPAPQHRDPSPTAVSSVVPA